MVISVEHTGYGCSLCIYNASTGCKQRQEGRWGWMTSILLPEFGHLFIILQPKCLSMLCRKDSQATFTWNMFQSPIQYLTSDCLDCPRYSSCWQAILVRRQASGSIRDPIFKNMVESNWGRDPLLLDFDPERCTYVWAPEHLDHILMDMYTYNINIYTLKPTIRITIICDNVNHAQKDKSDST